MKQSTSGHRVSSEVAFFAPGDPTFVTIDAAIHEATTRSKKGIDFYVSTYDVMLTPPTVILGRAVKGRWQWSCVKCKGAGCAACDKTGYQ